MNESISIMLVEDHPQYRNVIKMALGAEPDMLLCGLFGAAESALRSLEDETTEVPDIILLDLNLPGQNGLDAMPSFSTAAPNARIIVLTQSNSEADVLQAIQQGAAGYLLKSSTVQQIKNGIRTVMEGGASLDWSVAHFILEKMNTKKASRIELEKPLSNRELEILTLLSEGLVKKEIGDKLAISYSSVATYIRRIYEKLCVLNAAAAVAKAYKIGIFRPDK